MSLVEDSVEPLVGLLVVAVVAAVVDVHFANVVANVASRVLDVDPSSTGSG